jgi:hypothetical protein
MQVREGVKLGTEKGTKSQGYIHDGRQYRIKDIRTSGTTQHDTGTCERVGDHATHASSLHQPGGPKKNLTVLGQTSSGSARVMSLGG